MNEDPFERIRQHFIASLPVRATRLRAILDQEHGLTDTAERLLRDQLHQLAGSAGVFGIASVMQQAQRIGEQIRQQSATESRLPDGDKTELLKEIHAFIRFLEQTKG